MEDNQILNFQEWGIRVSRLMELIAMASQTIKKHREAGSSATYIRQYEELLREHTNELHDLMQTMGLDMQITPIDHAA